MSITAADIRREIKEKNVTFLRLMFTDIMGIMKNVEIPATEEQVEKVLSTRLCLTDLLSRDLCVSTNQICISIRI